LLVGISRFYTRNELQYKPVTTKEYTIKTFNEKQKEWKFAFQLKVRIIFWIISLTCYVFRVGPYVPLLQTQDLTAYPTAP